MLFCQVCRAVTEKFAFLFFVIFFISGCSPFRPLRIEPIESRPVYDDLFPYYVEVCALSRIKPKEGPKGGRAGHAVMYLKGACVDPSVDYPAIAMCPEAAALNGNERGVGISVHQIFKNVNWVATPERDLFFYGQLPESEKLTEVKRRETIQKAIDLGIFHNVQIHESYLKGKPKEMATEEFIAAKSLGTDYGLNFGRSILCVKIPVTGAMMKDIIVYLNQRNQEYALTDEDYKWGALSDNCTHTIYNALANAHMMSPRLIRAGRVRQFFNLALPANAVVAMTDLASPDPLDDIRKIEKNEKQRTTLLKYHWLPTRHGALLRTVMVHEKNELYEVTTPGFETMILRSRFFQSRSRRLKQAFADKRFTDLETNLRWFEKQYETILSFCTAHLGSKKFDQEFLKTYCDYIAEQLKDTRDKISKLK